MKPGVSPDASRSSLEAQNRTEGLQAGRVGHKGGICQWDLQLGRRKAREREREREREEKKEVALGWGALCCEENDARARGADVTAGGG